MASKNATQVLIAGKIYRLSGYESEEYLQRVAAYLNGKIAEIKTIEGYNRLSPDMKNLLLNLNIADDYFKLKKQADQIGDQVTAKDREVYEIKHELISVTMKLEASEASLASLQEAHAEDQKRIAVLESQLAELRERTQSVEASGEGSVPVVAEGAALTAEMMMAGGETVASVGMAAAADETEVSVGMAAEADGAKALAGAAAEADGDMAVSEKTEEPAKTTGKSSQVAGDVSKAVAKAVADSVSRSEANARSASHLTSDDVPGQMDIEAWLTPKLNKGKSSLRL